MNVCQPLRAAFFFYECFRVLLLAVFLFIAPLGSGASGTFFPYLAFLSANALFPLMALFLWLRPEEYRNYLALYMAGKIIGVVSFFAWEIFTSREYPGAGNLAKSMILFGGSIFISFADICTVWGAWVVKSRYKQAENGGI
jgi:hypothetical protein